MLNTPTMQNIVKQHLVNIKLAKTQPEKMDECFILLEYLNNQKEKNLYDIIHIFTNSITDDCTNENCKFDVNKYYNLLFPNEMVYESKDDNKKVFDERKKDIQSRKLLLQERRKKINQEPLVKLEEEEIIINVEKPIKSASVPIFKIDKKPHTPLTKVNDAPCYDNIVDELKAKCYQLKKINIKHDYLINNNNNDNIIKDTPTIIFHDLQKNQYSKVQFNRSLIETIYGDMAQKYNIGKNKIYECEVSQDQVKNDNKFDQGVYIKKIGFNSYDVFEKLQKEEIITGYFFNGSKKTNEIKQIGNYGFLH